MTSKLNVLTGQCRAAVSEVRRPQLAASLVDQFLSTTRAPCRSVILSLRPSPACCSIGCPRNAEIGDGGDGAQGGFRSGADGDRLALRQKAVRRSHRLRHDNWVILGARCGRNSFSSGTTSVLRAVFASRDEPMASAPALPKATVSGQFVQIFGRKENPRGGDVLVKVRHR
jgi:hypothetical protein